MKRLRLIAVIALVGALVPVTPAAAARPRVRIVDVKVTEGTGTNVAAKFVVRLSKASGRRVKVAYKTVADSAKAGSDFVAKTGTLRFQPGTTQKVIKVAVVGDSRDEGLERFKLVLRNPVAVSIADKTGIGTINDNDPLPSLSIGNETLGEPSGTSNMTFTVQLSARSGRRVLFHYATAHGTAGADDFTPTQGDAIIPAGSTSSTISVPIASDAEHEGDETFTVVLSNLVNAGGPGPATGTIEDDDPFMVANAVATSATELVLTFNGAVDPLSVTADGSQFVFDHGLVASAAVAAGDQVTVTTSAQSAIDYTVTVAASLTSASGAALLVDSAMFGGFIAPAELELNEVSPDLPNGQDKIELRVVSGGTVEGMRVEVRAGASNTATLAALPDLSVATDDIIVIHLGPAYAVEAPGSETTAKTQYPSATYAQNYDTAWDVRGITTGVATTDQTLTIFNATDETMDAAVFTDAGGTTVSAFLTSLSFLQGAGEWLPANCGGVTCSDITTPTAEGISVDWTGVGNTVTGNTVRRGTSDNDTAADWTVGAQSLGAAN